MEYSNSFQQAEVNEHLIELFFGLSAQIFLKKKTPVVSQSHYNPVLSLAEYFLFPKLIV